MNVMKKNFESNRLAYFFICLICLLIICRDVNQIPINKYIFVLIYCIYFVFSDSRKIVGIISFTLPFLNGLPGNWILLATIFVLFFKKDFHLNYKKVGIPFIVVLAEVLHSFLYIDNGIYDATRYFIYILIICFVVFDNDLEINYQECLNFFVLGVIFMCTIIFLTTLEYYPIETIYSGEFRYGNLTNLNLDQDMYLSNNQNNIGYYCALGISALLSISYISKKKFMLYIGMPIIVFYGLLTMSRAFILTTMGVILLYFIITSARKNILRNIGSIIFFLIIILFIYVIFSGLMPNVIEGILNRFEEADITNGRGSIFTDYNQFLFDNPIYFIFGTGLLGINEVTGIRGVPHNGFQQVFIAYGIIGFITFLSVIAMIIKSAVKGKKKIPYVAYLPFICMLIYVQSIQLLNPFELMLPVLIAFFSIRLYASDVSF